MTIRGLLALVVMMLFLAACSKTTVVKLNGETPSNAQVENTPAAESTAPATNTSPAPAPVTNPVATSMGDNPPVKCVDSDGDDPLTSGKVTVTYKDGTKKEFIDECPGGSNVETEYVCAGNDVKTKNTICTQLCVVGVCID